MLSHYIYGNILSVVIHKTGFYATEITEHKPNLVRTFILDYGDKNTFFETFSGIMTKEFSKKYDLVDIAFVTKQMTVVPNDIFDNYPILDYFPLSASYFSQDPLRFSKAVEEDITVAYSYNEKIEDFLLKTFDCVRFIHSGSRLIDKSKEGINVVLYENQLEICVKNNNEIAMYSVEDISNTELIISYIQKLKTELQCSQDLPIYFYGKNLLTQSALEMCSQKELKVGVGNTNAFLNDLFPLID